MCHSRIFHFLHFTYIFFVQFQFESDLTGLWGLCRLILCDALSLPIKVCWQQIACNMLHVILSHSSAYDSKSIQGNFCPLKPIILSEQLSKIEFSGKNSIRIVQEINNFQNRQIVLRENTFLERLFLLFFPPELDVLIIWTSQLFSVMSVLSVKKFCSLK